MKPGSLAKAILACVIAYLVHACYLHGFLGGQPRLQRLVNIALSRDDARMLEKTLVRGADPNALTGRLDNSTHLHRALRWNSLECIKLLLKFGADANRKLNYGWPPLAVYLDGHKFQNAEEEIEVLELLVKHGAKLDHPVVRQLLDGLESEDPVRIWIQQRTAGLKP